MLDISCVIFAGGKSSRMGEDKSLLPFSSFDTLTEYQFSRLKKIFKSVYVSTKDKNKFNFNAPFIEDVKTDDIFAPTIGFVTMFKEIKDEKVFVLSVDSPFVSEKQIKKIFEADSDEFDATVALTDFGSHPMCGIYHRSFQNAFEDMLKNDNHKLGFLLKNSKTQYIHFEDEKPFLNLNNPHEYEEALKLI